MADENEKTVTPEKPVTQPPQDNDSPKKESIPAAVSRADEKRLRQIETKLAESEKSNQDLRTLLEGFQTDFNKLKSVPSKDPQKSMFDVFCDALGWSHVENIASYFQPKKEN